MKAVMIGLTVLACALSARGETFQMDRKGEMTVEVREESGEYRVTCTFKPQEKFDKAVNAKFNDAKGDSLCKKGLARYLKVGADEMLDVSGQYSAAPVETVGDRLRYSFGVPVAGCQVRKAPPKPESRPQLPSLSASPTAVASTPLLESTNSLLSAPSGLLGTTTISPETTNDVQDAEAEMPPKTARAARTTSFLCVTEYREVNGERTEVSRREYQGRNFKSPKEFDRFCQREFARIRALGEANLRAVRGLGK